MTEKSDFIPFVVSCKIKINNTKLCEIELKDGYPLTLPVPYNVRFCFKSITEFYKSEKGQEIIKEKLKERDE